MNTVRVDIAYRPLRLAWAIRSGDLPAFRQAVRLSYALWGGCFNPIVFADREQSARDLVDTFRVDTIWGIGDSEALKTVPTIFPHLIKPFFLDRLFSTTVDGRSSCRLLDIHNALVYFRDRPLWKAVTERGVRLYTWQPDDPLGDVFATQFGAYPNPEGVGIDYRRMVAEASGATEHPLGSPSTAISGDLLPHPSIRQISRLGLSRHYEIDRAWDGPGFFVGDASDLDDLVCHWNLRAADIPVWFVDPHDLSRFAEVIPAWEQAAREMVADRREWNRVISVWSRREDIEEVVRPFAGMQPVVCRAADDIWNGLNIRPPMMHLGETSALGVVGQTAGKTRVSFSLHEKPFSDAAWFYQQHLVASIACRGSLSDDEQHTLLPPYVPELNEFYARTMHVLYDRLRIEPGRLGLIIDVTDRDDFILAMPVSAMMSRLFETVGFHVEMKASGLIVRQLIAHVGGLQGARVLKIPGVRRLLRTHGPTKAFTKRTAFQMIAEKEPGNPAAKFSDHESLYIEQRPGGNPLRPSDVFGYLVEKGLFRLGVETTCPSCRMSSWTAVDTLKARISCDLCGHEHDVARQLANTEWQYRRSGILGAEKNAQGAVPVVLTLQQLETNLYSALLDGMYSPSLELSPKPGLDLPQCELDFVWLIRSKYPEPTSVILGECKDRGPIQLDEFAKDVANLCRVADALPAHRYKAFVLLAKLAPFTTDEIEIARKINDGYQQRAILLTERELEPYSMYERTKAEFDITGHAGTPDDLAEATARIYFRTSASG